MGAFLDDFGEANLFASEPTAVTSQSSQVHAQLISGRAEFQDDIGRSVKKRATKLSPGDTPCGPADLLNIY